MSWSLSEQSHLLTLHFRWMMSCITSSSNTRICGIFSSVQVLCLYCSLPLTITFGEMALWAMAQTSLGNRSSGYASGFGATASLILIKNAISLLSSLFRCSVVCCVLTCRSGVLAYEWDGSKVLIRFNPILGWLLLITVDAVEHAQNYGHSLARTLPDCRLAALLSESRFKNCSNIICISPNFQEYSCRFDPLCS